MGGSRGTTWFIARLGACQLTQTWQDIYGHQNKRFHSCSYDAATPVENMSGASVFDSLAYQNDTAFLAQGMDDFLGSSTPTRQQFESSEASAKFDAFARELDPHQQSAMAYVPTFPPSIGQETEPWTGFLTDASAMTYQMSQTVGPVEPKHCAQQQYYRTRPRTVAYARQRSCKPETKDATCIKALSDSGYGTRGFKSPESQSQLSVEPQPMQIGNLFAQPPEYPSCVVATTESTPPTGFDIWSGLDLFTNNGSACLEFDHLSHGDTGPIKTECMIRGGPPWYCNHKNCDGVGKPFKNQSDFK